MGQCANETKNEDDIESLTDLNDICDNNEDLFTDIDGAVVIPLEFEQVCLILRKDFKHETSNKFHGCVATPILDFLYPKEGKEEGFQDWIKLMKECEPTLLAGIAFQNSSDSRQIYVIKGKHGLDANGYDSKVLLLPNCLSKSTLLPGMVWPQEIQDFVKVADVLMGGTDFNNHVLAYNSVIFAIGLSATPVGHSNFWNPMNTCERKKRWRMSGR